MTTSQRRSELWAKTCEAVEMPIASLEQSFDDAVDRSKGSAAINLFTADDIRTLAGAVVVLTKYGACCGAAGRLEDLLYQEVATTTMKNVAIAIAVSKRLIAK